MVIQATAQGSVLTSTTAGQVVEEGCNGGVAAEETEDPALTSYQRTVSSPAPYPAPTAAPPQRYSWKQTYGKITDS